MQSINLNSNIIYVSYICALYYVDIIIVYVLKVWVSPALYPASPGSKEGAVSRARQSASCFGVSARLESLERSHKKNA